MASLGLAGRLTSGTIALIIAERFNFMQVSAYVNLLKSQSPRQSLAFSDSKGPRGVRARYPGLYPLAVESP